MPKPSEKTFFKITDLSEEFARWEVNRPIKDIGEADIRSRYHLELIVWQVRAQLAIAQQLSIISKHLGEICTRAEATTKD